MAQSEPSSLFTFASGLNYFKAEEEGGKVVRKILTSAVLQLRYKRMFKIDSIFKLNFVCINLSV